MTAGWRERRGRHAGAAAALTVALLLTACTTAGPSAGIGAQPSHRTALHSSRVTALTNMSVLRSVFNHDRGHPRLVLILSPT